MRVLFVLPYVPSLIRVRPYHFIRELAKRHDVFVVAAAAPVRELADAGALRRLGVRVEVVPLSRTEGLRNCVRALCTEDPLQGAICRSRQAARLLADHVERFQPDVVHVEHFRAAYLRSVIPDTVPTLFDSVDCISLLQERTAKSSHSVRQRLLARFELDRTRRYESRILTQFGHVIVTSSEDKKALQIMSPEAAISVVPNGVDLAYFRPIDCEREPATLVFSGKMSYHANVTAVLHFVRDILPLVRQQHPEVRLVIAGSSPPSAVRALATDPAITVTGQLPDLRPILASATVAICPVTVKVGIQNKVLEAMAMGTPVVCSREGATGLGAIPEQDFLVGADANAFARQVCRLIEDPILRAKLGLAGRQYVEANHNWAVAASKVEELYDGLVNSHSSLNPTSPPSGS